MTGLRRIRSGAIETIFVARRRSDGSVDGAGLVALVARMPADPSMN